MLGRGSGVAGVAAVGRCPRGGLFVGTVLAANVGRAEPGDDSISPFSNTTGPADSTPSSDYVRKPTEPPRFDPNSPAATAARKAEAAKPRKVVSPKPPAAS